MTAFRSPGKGPSLVGATGIEPVASAVSRQRGVAVTSLYCRKSRCGARAFPVLGCSPVLACSRCFSPLCGVLVGLGACELPPTTATRLAAHSPRNRLNPPFKWRQRRRRSGGWCGPAKRLRLPQSLDPAIEAETRGFCALYEGTGYVRSASDVIAAMTDDPAIHNIPHKLHCTGGANGIKADVDSYMRADIIGCGAVTTNGQWSAQASTIEHPPANLGLVGILVRQHIDGKIHRQYNQYTQTSGTGNWGFHLDDEWTHTPERTPQPPAHSGTPGRHRGPGETAHRAGFALAALGASWFWQDGLLVVVMAVRRPRSCGNTTRRERRIGRRSQRARRLLTSSDQGGIRVPRGVPH
jgi:hypothetical protein